MPIKKAKLRAIDQGTRYDITGQLRRLVRDLESGRHGQVKHVVVGIKSYVDDNPKDHRPIFTTFAFGNSSMAENAYTTDMMKRRITGAHSL